MSDVGTSMTPRSDANAAPSQQSNPLDKFPAELKAFMISNGFDCLTAWVNQRTIIHEVCDKVEKDPSMEIVGMQAIAVTKPTFLSVRVQSRQAKGWTPLHLLANNKDVHGGKARLIAALSQRKADLELKLDKGEKTPLCMAAASGNKAGCIALLEMRANANYANSEGTTVYDLARANHYDLAEFLRTTWKCQPGAGVTGKGRFFFSQIEMGCRHINYLQWLIINNYKLAVITNS